MRRRRSGAQSGLTLLEIMIALVVVALATAAIAATYQRLPMTMLRRDAARLAAAMRTAYDRATASGTHHRLVINLDDQSYHVEQCEGTVQMERASNVKEEIENRKAEEEKRQQDGALLSPEEAIAQTMSQGQQAVGGSGAKGQAMCKPIARSALGKPQKLESHPRVVMSKVYVGHLDEPASVGQVTLTFFPIGYAERGVIELQAGAEDDPDRLSIVLHPTTGRVQVIPGTWRDALDFITRDTEGKNLN
jgi:type II secretion system protein H